MNLSPIFFLTALGFGVSLAMDAFSVSLANGLGEPKMKPSKMFGIAGMFSFFQGLMPMLGWICIHTIAEHSEKFKRIIPWISLILLVYIGGKMLIDGIRSKCENEEKCGNALSFSALIIQGIATSIDALSVGFGISDYKFSESLLNAFIIAVITFFICLGGIIIGKNFGTHLAGKASILGGIILIAIGIEIFVEGLMG